MQNANKGNITKRITYYLNLLYSQELEKGKDYQELNKTIAIGILNFDYFDDIKEYHTIWKMTEQANKNKTLEEQEIHFIELPKFLKSEIDVKRKLDQWLLFIDYSRKELIQMAEENNKIIKEASEAYDILVGDEKVRELAFLRRKGELDYNSGMRYAQEKGMAEGRAEGEKNKQLEIAKNMIKKGMNIKDIAEITGLSEEELNNI